MKHMKSETNFANVGKYTWWCMLMVFLMVFAPIQAQNVRSISGQVVDDKGEPIIGANVTMVGNKSLGTITDIDGNFSLKVPGGATLDISYIGYVTRKVKLDNKVTYSIVLQEDSEQLDEVVVVGYGTQKKVNLTGAVSAIDNEELAATKNQNTQNMLTGKIAGVRVIQKTSEPGEFSNQFDIRGFGSPLIVVDGVPRGDFQRMDPNEIESISVLKDASAAIYGVRAANGVVLITTKKGEKNKAKIEYNMYYGIQTPAEMLEPVGAVDRMTLFNEKSMRNLTNPELTYSDDQIADYLNGTLKSTDWYDAVIRNTAPQQQHNISMSGGSDKMDYYVNFGYTDQEGFFKSKAMDYNRYNLRVNLNANVAKNLKASIKINGILDSKERQYTPTWEIYKALWRASPNEKIYANDNPEYFQKMSSDALNLLASTDPDVSGYNKTTNKIFQSTMELEYTVPFVKGLKVKGMFSYDNTIADNTIYKKEFNEYNYSPANDTYTAYAMQSPTNLERYYGNSWTTLWQASVSYDNTFATDHHVSGLLLFEEAHNVGDNFRAARDFSIPLPYLFAGNSTNQIGTANANGLTESASQALVGRFNYDFKGRYLLEFAFRYDGSSKFPAEGRWGFFPSASLGWRLSEESFIKDNLSFVNNLKIRGSYGKMGDDVVAAYQFISGYDYPNTAGSKFNNTPIGYFFNGSFVNSLGFRAVANPNITWYTVKTLNVGIDADMWNGLLGFSFDLFKRNRDGLMASRIATIPGTFGASMPKENLESDCTKGLEIELRHRNRIDEVSYGITGNVAITRSLWRYKERTPSGNSYDNWRNNMTDRYNDIWFGYGSGGRYDSWNQIVNSPIFAGNATLPGDYIYEDWNGDGTIDDMDKYPIATATNASAADFQDKKNYPLMNFGLTLSSSWKGFDVNLTFQGSAMSYVAYGEQLSAPLQFNGNALDMFLDRWRPVDPKQDPYDPSCQWNQGFYAYGGITPDTNSDFSIQKGTYVRLKTAEIGYTLPKRWLAPVGVQNLRVYMNGYNLFTITGVKGVDPERPAELYGYMYPLNRTFNFGASITF
ncbi:TonB-dependent receptor [Bacteroides sp.]|uniref:SusC/RagA family TonB-linked outer membrane protein n=1 Tax=Bacteroides sp. TaxID=29523 RepID=UPI00261D2A67|nr:TonB-dependent receptor [Bacteroides sp.]